MRGSVGPRIFVSKKGMICICLLEVRTGNLWQKAERGKKTYAEPSTRFLQASCSEKFMHSVPEIWRRTNNVLPWSAKGMRKRDEKLDSCAAKKGAKKLVSSNFAKILE